MQLGSTNTWLRTLDPHTPPIVKPMAGNINPTCIDMSSFRAKASNRAKPPTATQPIGRQSAKGQISTSSPRLLPY